MYNSSEPVYHALWRAQSAYRLLMTHGHRVLALRRMEVNDSTGQPITQWRWHDTKTARYIYLKSNGSFGYSERIIHS